MSMVTLVLGLAMLLASAKAQVNYIQLKNPSFEAGTTNWIFGKYASLVTAGALSYSGTNSVAIGAANRISQRNVPSPLGVTNCVVYHFRAIHGATERIAILQASQPYPGTNRAEIRQRVSNQGWHPLVLKWCWTNGPAKVDVFAGGDCVAFDQ